MCDIESEWLSQRSRSCVDFVPDRIRASDLDPVIDHGIAVTGITVIAGITLKADIPVAGTTAVVLTAGDGHARHVERLLRSEVVVVIMTHKVSRCNNS